MCRFDRVSRKWFFLSELRACRVVFGEGFNIAWVYERLNIA